MTMKTILAATLIATGALSACAPGGTGSADQINTQDEALINSLESQQGGQADTRIDQIEAGEI